jgi:hypothetical protein
MVVDVMLLRPAVDRAVQTLKPVIEFTRTARAVDPAALPVRSAATAPAATPAEAPAAAVDVARSIGEGPQ